MAKRITDPTKPVRVFKDKADLARQKRLEGANTPFQRRLRQAEARGEKTFMYEGNPYAANVAKGPSTIKAGLRPSSPLLPPPSVIPNRPILSNPKVDAFPAPPDKVKGVKRSPNPGRFKMPKLKGGGMTNPGQRQKRRLKIG
jgi:hypothetical protein